MTTFCKDDIAIVGVGCKVPGANNVEEFWRVLENGENHVIDIPNERWNNDAFLDEDPHAVGKSYVMKAGLLKDPLAFDNKLFNINDFEADQMDPQQRYILECSHMALEDAGITREKLAGSNTGVYIGAMNGDYRGLFTSKSPMVGNYTVTGISNSIIAARVSYIFDTRGPSVTLDTACSSALFAIHVGSQALRMGDCDMALCGGTNFLMAPDVFVHLSKAHMISPTGQCYAFSDQADGYTRGEGCGVVILKRFENALRDGDKIWGTIQTGSNQDGHSVTPIAAPSGDQQETLLHKVYSSIDVDVDRIDYIEAHGTGTAAGDPVEANAIGNFFKSKRSLRSRYMGSVKTNLGHLESAAGVAGLIKVLLMMKHSKIVPSLHFDKAKANPKIDFPDLKIEVPTELLDWSTPNKVASINCFGFGGTNCHAIIHDYDVHHEKNTSTADNGIPCIVAFSAKHEKSLKGSMQEFIGYPDLSEMNIHDVSYTSTARRDHYNIRYATVVEEMPELIEKLQDFVQRKGKGVNNIRRIRVIFVFCGMGTSWRGMCKEMMASSSAFKDAIVEVDALLSEYVDWSLVDKLEKEVEMDDPEICPIAIFACQVALGKLWISLGVKPSCLIGQSIGEIAAAYFANVLSLRDAVKVIYYRTFLMAKVAGGKMIIVRNLSINNVHDIIKKYPGGANVALEYSPVSCAISGDLDSINKIKLDLASKSKAMNTKVQVIDLHVPVAYHSHHVDSCKAGLREALADIMPQLPETEMVSTVTGETVVGILGPDHWVDNMRETVKFGDGLLKTWARGYKNVYIEIGPKPVMKAHAPDIFPKEDVMPIASMTRQPEWKFFLTALATVYEMGCKIEWGTFPHKSSAITSIPRYVYNPRRSLQICESAHMILAGVHYMRKEHPFVNRVDASDKFKAMVSRMTFPSVYDHIVSGMLIIPGAFYAEIGFAVAKHSSEMNAPLYSVSVTFEQPCSFSRDGVVQLEIDIQEAKPRGYGIEKFKSYQIAVERGGKKFASVNLQAHNMNGSASAINIRHIQARCPQNVDREEIYGTLKRFGFAYGPGYSLLMHALRNTQECLAKIFVPKEMFLEIAGTTIHPSILDGMLQTSIMLMGDVDDARDLLPRSIGRLVSYRQTEDEMYIYTKLKSSDRRHALYDIKLTTLYGEIIADLEDLTIKSLTDKTGGLEDTYRCIWKPIETIYPKQETTKPSVLFITDHIPEDTPATYIKQCIQFNLTENPEPDLWKDLTFRLSQNSGYEFIVVVTNANLSDSEDAYSIQSKTLNMCMVLKAIYHYAVEKTLTIPIYFFTKRAFILDSEDITTYNVNPIMTALWGMTRCALKEQIYTDFVSFDLHLPDDRCKLPFLTSVVEIVHRDEYLKLYPEYLVTENKMYVNQIVQVEPEMQVPTFRHNYADKGQNVILLSKESTVLTDTFPVYYEAPNNNGIQSYIDIEVSATALQSNKLFNVSMLLSVLERRHNLKGNGYPFFALESIGEVERDVRNKKQKKCKIQSISCYPSPLGSKIRVPEAATITADMIENYVPGDLTRFMLLWSLHHSITTKNVTILASSATVRLGEVLICLIMTQRKSKLLNINLVVVEELDKVEALSETIVSLVLLEETVIPLVMKRWIEPKFFICLSPLVEETARASLLVFLPTVKVKLLDPYEIFHPNNLITVVPQIRRWMKKHPCLMGRVASCLHKSPFANGVFSEKVADIDDLLSVQVTQMKSSVVRVEKSELFRTDSIYIVVGGLTGLGWLFVRFLASNGAGHIAILNRRTATIEKTEEINQLALSENCKIQPFQADVTRLDSLKSFFNSVKTAFPGTVFKGVFFGAAVVDDQLLVQIDSKTFEKVLSPKVMGAWNLHQLTKDLPLDYFVMHSSVTSVFGNAGQTSYGAGNAFMDGLAQYRKSLKLCGQSINWGALDLGMLSDFTEVRKILESQGFVLMSDDDIFSAIVPILLLDWAQITPCKFDDEVLLKRLKRDMLVPFQYRLKSMLGSVAEEVKIEEDILLALQTARSLPPEERVDVYERYVIALATQVLSAEENTIKSDSNLVDIGMDSIVAMTMINQIYKEVHCRLPAIVFISGDPTIRTIAQAIDDVLSGKMNEGSEFGPDEDELAEAAKSIGKEKTEEIKAIEPPPPKRRVSFAASIIESSQLAIYKRHPRKQSLHGVVDINIPPGQEDPETVKQAIMTTLVAYPTARTVYTEDFSRRSSVMSFEKTVLPAESAIDFRTMHGKEEDIQNYSEEAFDTKVKAPLRFILQEAGSKSKLRIVFHKAGFDVRAIHQFIQGLVDALDPNTKESPEYEPSPEQNFKESEDFNLQLEHIHKAKADTFAQFWAKTLSKDVANTSLREQLQFPPKCLIATNGSLSTMISPELTQKMIAFIRFNQVSLLGLVAGCYQILLHVLTGKQTISLMFPVDLRRYIIDLNNDMANYCNEIPLIAQFAELNNVGVQEFIISNNKRIQQHIDNGMLPFTLFQGLAERTMEMFDQSPHGISIQMLTDGYNIHDTSEGISKSAILPMGLETNLFIQHDLSRGIIVLNLGYKECIMKGMRAEVLLKNLVSLLAGILGNSKLVLRHIKKYTRGLNTKMNKKPFCAVQ